jgi:hypothetical protein
MTAFGVDEAAYWYEKDFDLTKRIKEEKNETEG